MAQPVRSSIKQEEDAPVPVASASASARSSSPSLPSFESVASHLRALEQEGKLVDMLKSMWGKDTTTGSLLQEAMCREINQSQSWASIPDQKDSFLDYD